MARINILPIGTKLKLTKAWKFKLYFRDHVKCALNYDFARACGFNWYNPDNYFIATLPEGIILEVEKYYIKRGHVPTVTFKFEKSFWVFLEDVNTLEYETYDPDQPVQPVKVLGARIIDPIMEEK